MTTVAAIKGNNGRAARKAFFRRLVTILLAFAVTIFGLFLLGIGRGRNVINEQGQHRDLGRINFRKHAANQLKQIPPEKEEEEEEEGEEEGQEENESPSDDTDEEDAEDPIVELDLEDAEQNKRLLSAEFLLIDVEVDREAMDEADEDTYAGITAEFCKVDFSIHKKDPSSVPMFRFLVDASPGCKNGVHYKANLRDFVAMARAHDANPTGVKTLKLSGVVFHESRCGSTLVANALAAMNPAENRVYSESAPPIAALRNFCGEDYSRCSLKQAARILSDIIYLMSRSRDPIEERVFFKIQSIGTRNIEVFQTAFPHTPWIFVYRDPVQVMMSQLANGPKYANCVRPRTGKSSLVSGLSHFKGVRIKDLSDEEYCALHLATITEAAVKAMQRDPQHGTAVNYAKLPEALYTDIIPNKFGVPLSTIEINNIIKISSVYSKGTSGRQGKFKDDSQHKEKSATTAVRDAARFFLDESYATLERGGMALSATS